MSPFLYRSIGKTKVLNESFNQLLYKFYPHTKYPNFGGIFTRVVKFKFDLTPSTFWCFLVNFMKIGCQRKDYKVVTWNCHTQLQRKHLHCYNRNSHAHNALLKIPSTCIISMKIVTNIFVAKTFSCVNVAEISNCVIATETVICIIAIQPQNLHNCNKCMLAPAPV